MCLHRSDCGVVRLQVCLRCTIKYFVRFRHCVLAPVDDYQELASLETLLVFESLVLGDAHCDEPVDERTYSRAADCSRNEAGEWTYYHKATHHWQNEEAHRSQHQPDDAAEPGALLRSVQRGIRWAVKALNVFMSFKVAADDGDCPHQYATSGETTNRRLRIGMASIARHNCLVESD